MLEDDFNIQATDWGWQMKNNVITPMMTDKAMAPESLTKVIRCKCKVRQLNLELISLVTGRARAKCTHVFSIIHVNFFDIYLIFSSSGNNKESLWLKNVYM